MEKTKITHALFILDKNIKGIEHIDTPLFSHTYAHHHSIFRFNNVKISKNNIIGKEGDGMTFTHSWFRHERLGIAARCCGAAERLIDEATNLLKRENLLVTKYQTINLYKICWQIALLN